jgi:hypothetical protein
VWRSGRPVLPGRAARYDRQRSRNLVGFTISIIVIRDLIDNITEADETKAFASCCATNRRANQALSGDVAQDQRSPRKKRTNCNAAPRSVGVVGSPS